MQKAESGMQNAGGSRYFRMRPEEYASEARIEVLAERFNLREQDVLHVVKDLHNTCPVIKPDFCCHVGCPTVHLAREQHKAKAQGVGQIRHFAAPNHLAWRFVHAGTKRNVGRA